jgi:cytochrome c-type biogenesis protein CcmH
MSATDTNFSEPPARRASRWWAAGVLALLGAAALLWNLKSGEREAQSTAARERDFGVRTASAPTSPAPETVKLEGGPQTAPAAAAAAAAASPLSLSASQVQRSVERASASVKQDPKDAAAWAMLAHSEQMLGHYAEANKAYAQLVALRPNDALVHAEAAESLGAAQGGSLAGEPAQLIAKALSLDPANTQVQVLAGKLAFEQRLYEQAIAAWDRARKATQDATVQRQLDTSVAEARALAATAAGKSASAPAGLAFISGRVTLADALKDQVQAGDTVFIFARPAEGSRMPVALLRRKASDLPLDFALDDTLAMVPQSRLSLHQRVMVGVRISRRGDAVPAKGDLQGQLGPIAVGSTGLKLVISDVVP